MLSGGGAHECGGAVSLTGAARQEPCQEQGRERRQERERARVRVACTPLARFRGLRALPLWDGVLVLAPCSDIHTCFVARPVDVAFADSAGVVLQTYESVSPWQRRRCRGACFTLERWAVPGNAWFVAGQRLRLVP